MYRHSAHEPADMKVNPINPASAPAPPPRRTHLLLVAAAFTLLAVYGSFVPLEYHPLDWSAAVQRFSTTAWLHLGVYKRADLVANLLLFLPLGFCWLGAIDLDRTSRMPAFLGAPLVILTLAALAVAVEFFQLWFPRRTVSLNDIAAEIAGAGCGVILWWLVGRTLITAVRRAIQPDAGAHPIVRLLRLYALGLLLYSIQPLDLTFSPAEISRKIADGKVNLLPFTYDFGGLFQAAWGMGIDIILFLPIGMMFRLGRAQRTVFHAATLTVLFAIVIEATQLFVFSRFVDTTDVVMAGLGGLIGAALVGRWRTADDTQHTRAQFSPSKRILIALLLTLLYAVPLAAAFWHPFHLQRDSQIVLNQLHGMLDLPFRKLYFTSEFSALSHILRGLMLFLPLGAIWRWACGGELQQSFAARGLVLALILTLGFAIELGQAFMIDQYADTTDLLIYLCGAGAGWWLCGILTRDVTRQA